MDNHGNVGLFRIFELIFGHRKMPKGFGGPRMVHGNGAGGAASRGHRRYKGNPGRRKTGRRWIH